MSALPTVRDFIAAETAALLQRVLPPTGDLGYGVDLVCVDDLDPHLAETAPNSTQDLAQAAYHRVNTARGSLPDDPNYGIDLVGYLNTPHTPGELSAIEGQVALELKKDDRYQEVAVTVFGNRPDEFTVQIVITPADPAISTFTLILAVTDGALLLQEINT